MFEISEQCQSIYVILQHYLTDIAYYINIVYRYEEALEFLKNGFQGPRSEEENKIKIEEINIDYKNVVNEKKEEVKEEVGENNSYMRLPNKKDERAQMM